MLSGEALASTRSRSFPLLAQVMTSSQDSENEFYEGAPHGRVERHVGSLRSLRPLAALAQLADSRKLDKQRLLLKKEIRLLTNLRI